MEKKKYYISTAIAYTSAKPHIGNTYEIVLADAIARFKRLEGYDVYFQTGTDEHGEKIQQKAEEAGKKPQEFVDDIVTEVKSIWDCMNTSYDKFVRTTDPEHMKKVSEIFERLYQQGDIYKGVYEGLYCTPCESFFTESQLIDGKCPDCGREVKKASEENKTIEKVVEDLDEMSADENERLEAYKRKLAIIDYNTSIDLAHKEGERAQKLKMAKKLKEKGMALEEIMDIAELTKEEIENL